MSTIRTRPEKNYIPPSREEVKEMSRKVDISTFSYDLVEDITNLLSGGRVNPSSIIRQEVEREIMDNFPKANSDGEWKLKSGGYTKNLQTKKDELINSKVSYHNRVNDFLQSLDFSSIPGSSPLEQALNLIKVLGKTSGNYGNSSEDNGEPLPIFNQDSNPEKIAKEINDLFDDIESLSEEEKQLFDPENEGEEDNLRSMKIAEDMQKGKSIMLQISRQLDKLSKMQVVKCKKQMPDPEGNTVRVRPIKSISEMSRMVKSEWANPSTYRTYRIVSGTAQVRERVNNVEKKQLLYIIVDCSGSMSSGQRIYKAGGIIMNRIKAVISGDAEIYIRMFDEELKTERHVITPEEGKEVMKYYTGRNYSGGGTAIANCAKLAKERIEEIINSGESLYRPELVIITDGDDNVDNLHCKDFKGTKVHAFTVDNENNKLLEFAKSTGGVGIHI